MASIIRLNFNKVAKEAESDEELTAGIRRELAKIEKLATPDWREAFAEHGESTDDNGESE